MHNKKIIKSISIICVFLFLGIFYLLYWYGFGNSSNSNEFFIDSNKNNTGEIQIDTVSETSTENTQIYVYVCGAVNNPGVYCMPAHSRMFEALEMAGGLREDAGAGYLELAKEVADGQRIYVPTDTEESLSTFENTSKGLININTATKEQLMTLPGIGDARADAIIEYRESNGGFNSIDELMQISGIKDAAFQKIKERICT